MLDALLHGLLSLSGLANESMVRDQGWQFMEAGRRIERALHVTLLVGSALSTEHSAPVESLIVESVLTAGESIITARRRYRSHALASTTIDLLFGDARQPPIVARSSSTGSARALRCCPPIVPVGTMSSALQLLGEVGRLVDGIDSRRLAHVDDTGYRRDLDRFVSTVRAKLSSVVRTPSRRNRSRGSARNTRWSVRSTSRDRSTSPRRPGGSDVIYQVSHTTRYDYDAPVVASFAELRQLPDDVDGQVCLHRAITTDPVAEHQREHRDYFGNLAAIVVVREEHTQLVVTSTSMVDTAGRPTTFGDDGRRPWRSYTAAEAPSDDLTAVEFTLDSTLVTRSEQLAEYARPSFGHDTSLADGVMSLAHGFTPISSSTRRRPRSTRRSPT